MQSLNILLVDDDPVQLEVTQSTLQKAGFNELMCFDSPVRALGHAHSCRPDLLITDYHMPVFTGGQLLRKLLHLYPDLPAIIVTGAETLLFSSTDHAVVKKDGIDFYQELVTEIRKVTRNHQEAISGM